jgi:aminoglycoside 3-N-acetyltransferase
MTEGRERWTSLYSRPQLAEAFRALGVRPGDVVMLHASVRAVGNVAGGPDTIHLALSDALGARGTILMYAGCPRYVDEVGRGNLTADQEAELLEKLPAFDPATARAARDHGILAEFLRTYPGTRHNGHVARFIARGDRADELLDPTPWDYAFGYGSPLDRLVAMNGRILLLGSDHDNVTFLHYVEHVTDFPGKRVAHYQVPVLERGARVWREMSEFDTSGAGVHPHWPESFFARIVDAHLRRTEDHGGRVGDAQSYLIDVRALLEFARPVMQRVAADPGAADVLPVGPVR